MTSIPVSSKPWLPVAALVVCTAGWGVSFSLMRNWQSAPLPEVPLPGLVSSLTLIGLRMALALVLFALIRPRLVASLGVKDLIPGAMVGIPLWLGFVLQLWGLVYTTPAMSAFFTSLGSLWVPLLYLLVGRKIPLWIWLGYGLAFVGLVVLVEGGWRWGVGEFLSLGCSVLFAFQIIGLDRFGKSIDGNRISPVLFGINGLFSLFFAVCLCVWNGAVEPWGAWIAERLTDGPTLWDLGLMVVFPSLMSYSLMNAFQPLLSAERAAIIYLLEPIFSLLFSLWFGHDELHIPVMIGGVLILAGVAWTELGGGIVGGKEEAGKDEKAG